MEEKEDVFRFEDFLKGSKLDELMKMKQNLLEEGVFDIRVALKSGSLRMHRMGGGEILREYGAYLTVTDRQRIAKGHKHRRHWSCSVM